METIKNHALKIYASVLAVLISVMAFAQEKLDVDVDVGGGETAWYGNPVVWIIGAALFVLILVALLRGGNRND